MRAASFINYEFLKIAHKPIGDAFNSDFATHTPLWNCACFPAVEPWPFCTEELE